MNVDVRVRDYGTIAGLIGATSPSLTIHTQPLTMVGSLVGSTFGLTGDPRNGYWPALAGELPIKVSGKRDFATAGTVPGDRAVRSRTEMTREAIRDRLSCDDGNPAVAGV